MRKITEVLRLKFEAKLSHATIARAVGLSKGAVNKYVSLAQARGLSWPLPEGLERRVWRRGCTRRGRRRHATWSPTMRGCTRSKGVTLH